MRKMTTPLALCAGLLFLAGCQSSLTRSVADRPELARIPSTLKEPCAAVTDLPARDLSSAEAARLWGADRSALGECGRRHRALVDGVEAIEGQGR